MTLSKPIYEYHISGAIEGSSWEDFVCKNGPSVTIEIGKEFSFTRSEDGWFDATVTEFTKGHILKALRAITGSDHIVIVEHHKCKAV